MGNIRVNLLRSHDLFTQKLGEMNSLIAHRVRYSYTFERPSETAQHRVNPRAYATLDYINKIEHLINLTRVMLERAITFPRTSGPVKGTSG